MAFVGFQFARETLVTPLAGVIGLIAAAIVFRFRVNSAWVILGGAVCGLVAKMSAAG